MTTKRIVFAVMCVLLLATAVMTGVVASRIAPAFQMEATEPAETGGSTAPASAPTEESTEPTTRPDPTWATDDHDHVFELDHTQKATCSTNGFSLYICHCGETQYRDMVAFTGHAWGQGVYRQVSCIETGGTVYTCGNCGMENVKNAVQPTGHSYGDWEPDPEDDTMEIRVCESCGKQEQRDAEDPSVPTESVDPSEGTDPTESVDPSEGTDPTESVDPSEGTDPTESVDPSEGEDPTESVDPSEGLDPTGESQTEE